MSGNAEIDKARAQLERLLPRDAFRTHNPPSAAALWTNLGYLMATSLEADPAEKVLVIHGDTHYPYSSNDCYVRALECNPSDGLAWYNLGTQLGAPDDDEIGAGYGGSDALFVAIGGRRYTQRDCFVRAVELNPKNGDAWSSLGVLLRCPPHAIAVGGQSGVSEQECYQRALAINPRADTAWYNLGVHLAAIALSANPNDTTGEHEFATVAGRKYTERMCYILAAESNGRNAAALVSLGILLLGTHRRQQQQQEQRAPVPTVAINNAPHTAVQCFSAAANHSRFNTGAWCGLACALTEGSGATRLTATVAGRVYDSRACCLEALAVDGRCATAWALLGSRLPPGEYSQVPGTESRYSALDAFLVSISLAQSSPHYAATDEEALAWLNAGRVLDPNVHPTEVTAAKACPCAGAPKEVFNAQRCYAKAIEVYLLRRSTAGAAQATLTSLARSPQKPFNAPAAWRMLAQTMAPSDLVNIRNQRLDRATVERHAGDGGATFAATLRTTGHSPAATASRMSTTTALSPAGRPVSPQSRVRYGDEAVGDQFNYQGQNGASVANFNRTAAGTAGMHHTQQSAPAEERRAVVKTSAAAHAGGVPWGTDDNVDVRPVSRGHNNFEYQGQDDYYRPMAHALNQTATPATAGTHHSQQSVPMDGNARSVVRISHQSHAGDRPW